MLRKESVVGSKSSTKPCNLLARQDIYSQLLFDKIAGIHIMQNTMVEGEGVMAAREKDKD